MDGNTQLRSVVDFSICFFSNVCTCFLVCSFSRLFAINCLYANYKAKNKM